LDYNIGRDISKFFYGGYALDGNSTDPKAPNTRHSHTNVARKIVNKHIVGILDTKAVQNNRFKIDHEKTWMVTPVVGSFVFQMQKTNKLINSAQGLKNYYSDVRMIGKHFTVESYSEGGEPYRDEDAIVRRHYTIANAMQKNFYDELVRCLKVEASTNTINRVEHNFNMDLLN
jgi:hypothetical protein